MHFGHFFKMHIPRGVSEATFFNHVDHVDHDDDDDDDDDGG